MAFSKQHMQYAAFVNTGSIGTQSYICSWKIKDRRFRNRITEGRSKSAVRISWQHMYVVRRTCITTKRCFNTLTLRNLSTDKTDSVC